MAGMFTQRIWQPTYVNQTNLNGKIRKTGGENGGPSKNLGGMAHPGPPLESLLILEWCKVETILKNVGITFHVMQVLTKLYNYILTLSSKLRGLAYVEFKDSLYI